MPTFNPFKDMLLEISRIVMQLQENRKNLTQGVELPPDTDEKLKNVELRVKLLLQSLKMALDEHGGMVSKNVDLNKLPPETVNMIQQTKKFKLILEEMEREVKKQLTMIEFRKKSYGRKGDPKKFGETRKKRLQRLGGDGKGWIPL